MSEDSYVTFSWIGIGLILWMLHDAISDITELKGRRMMLKPFKLHASTSALSLLAMTACAVSATWLLMFVGCFVTLMALSAHSQSFTASSAIDESRAGLIFVATQAHEQRVLNVGAFKSVKGDFYRDALLREVGSEHLPALISKAEYSAGPAHLYNAAMIIHSRLQASRCIEI